MSSKKTSATPAGVPRGRSAFTRANRRSLWPRRLTDAQIREYLWRMRLWVASRARQAVGLDLSDITTGKENP